MASATPASSANPPAPPGTEGEGDAEPDEPTATQIVAANSEEYRTQQKHQLVLESLLLRFARTVLRLGRDFLGLPLDTEVPISVDFDRSTVENDGEEFERDISMLEHGILSKEEFRMKWINEDEQTAKDALADVRKENAATGEEAPIQAG